MTAVAVRYIHAGDLSTNDAHDLVWNVGSIEHRYQEIAIVGDRVIGSWTYNIEWRRGRAWIDSTHTDVSPRYRRKGIARALWFAGMLRWKPSRIESTIGTDEGRDFLARMTAEVAYRAPDVFLWVKRRTEDEDAWAACCWHASREILRKVGNHERSKTPPLKLLKGATA